MGVKITLSASVFAGLSGRSAVSWIGTWRSFGSTATGRACCGKLT
jgi:hypothetical protein